MPFRRSGFRKRRYSRFRRPIVRRRGTKRSRSSYLGSAVRRFGGAAVGAAGSLAGREAASAAWPYIRDVVKNAVGNAVVDAIPGGSIARSAWNAVKRYRGAGDDSAGAAAMDMVEGRGAYTIRKNTMLMDGAEQAPVMHSIADGVRIRHREYIQDIQTSTTFSNQTFVLNPGLSETFPWLSAIAQNFEQYEWMGVIVQLKSISSDAIASSTNLAMGTIIMAAEYNVAQPPYVNKQQMENSFFACSAKPSEDFRMPIECDPAENPLAVHYVRTGAVPSGQDPRMYDMCNLQVATVGSQAAYTVAELWISYDVILRKPQLDSGLALSSQTAHYSLVAPAVTTSYLGTSREQKFDSIGLTLSGTVVTFPLGCNGNYLVNYSARGASTASLVAPTLAVANCDYLTIYADDTSQGSSTTGSPTSTLLFQSYWVNIPNPNLQATITFSGGTLPSSPTYGDLFVVQGNGSLNS